MVLITLPARVLQGEWFVTSDVSRKPRAARPSYQGQKQFPAWRQSSLARVVMVDAWPDV
jgi:hypothetical protein